MRRTTITSLVVTGILTAGASLAATPAGADATSPRDNVGYCISDGFYGNQPNLDSDGNVVASQSPGPQRTLPDGTVVMGNSIGDYQRGAAVPGQSISIPALCQALVG